jgi:N6-adenosine-specific RNA methylase IME4
MEDLVLLKLGQAYTALAEAKTMQETKHIIDMAIAAETYAKRQKLGEKAIQYATSIKVEALRQLGNMLKETPRASGGQPYQERSTGTLLLPVENVPTLAELGIDKRVSKLAQDIASLPDEQYVKVQAGVMALTKVTEVINTIRGNEILANHSAKRSAPIPDGKYQVIYADPPWMYENSGFSESAESQYPTMPLVDICKIPVFEMSENTSVLFIWATNPLLQEGLAVLKAWGFEYKTNIAWVKDRGRGKGWFLKSRHELLLIGTRKQTPHPAIRPDSAQEFDRGNVHSRKPFEFYELIESMYPEGNKIELFARNSRPGWASWGNEEI